MAISTLGAPIRGSTLAHDPAIAVRELNKTYRGGTKALNGLSFTVPAGTVFALLGPNGAGKSTAVKVLTTLCRPDSGQVQVAGIDVIRHPDQVRHAVGVVAQMTAVDIEATGRENLELQGHLYGLSGVALKRSLQSVLERFGLEEVADRISKTYSGGTQRKLDVAMGLVHRPEVLFLDEPTTGLDPEARTEMWREISHLAKDDGLTVLLTTHYLEEADRLADQVAIMDKGTIVVQGTAEQLKSELHGDAVVLQLADEVAREQVFSAIARLGDQLRETSFEYGVLRARVDSGASALPGLLTVLDAAQLRVSTASVVRPSLDDVYLRYTGHAFSASEEKSK
ncbi:MAG: ATP-binding cassette domain-containing protein [Candidatus Dormiibacterota bacterium]